MTSKFDGYIPTPLRRRLGLPAPAARVSGVLSDRIDSSGGNRACWPWLGAQDRDGYGVVARTGRSHRLAWQQHNGRELGPEEVVRHTCDNRHAATPRISFSALSLRTSRIAWRREGAPKGR